MKVVELLSAAVIVLTWAAGCSGQADSHTSLNGMWKFAVDSVGVGEKEEWFSGRANRTGWKDVTVPGFWDELGLADYDGAGWYATTFAWKDTAAFAVMFEGVDDDADVWIAGRASGSHTGYNEPFFVLPPHGVKGDSISLVVRVKDNGGPGGLHRSVSVVPADKAEELMKSPEASRRARVSAPWVKNAVMYEVYLRSFSLDGFRGLERRLKELKDLGVTVVWLMPIHPVGELNRKGKLGSPYAIRDFYGINPEFGSADDFHSLVDSAHALDMRVIIDLVANHTAWDSKLLLEHPEWFTHDSDGAIVAPNASWSDVADLDYRSHELRKYMIAMMRYWVREFDIDGYRCDVAELVPSDFWDVARRELERLKPVLMLSEGSLPGHHLEAFDITYAWNTYDVLTSVLDGSASAGRVVDIIRRESRRYPQGSLRLRFNTNHDKNAWDAPAVEKFGDKGADVTAALMFTLPGVPLIYNGEEVGNSKRLDLFEQVVIDWKSKGRHREVYRTLGALRHDHSWLSTGSIRPLQHNGGGSILAYVRTDDSSGTSLLCIFNFAARAAVLDVPIPEDMQHGTTTDVVTNASLPRQGQLKVHLPAFGYALYLISP